MEDYFINSVKDNNIILLNTIFANNSININYDNNKAIMIACSYGYSDILKILIKKGANVNIHNGHLLTLAIMSKNYDCVTLLFENNIIITKYNFILSYCNNNINMFRHLMKYIDMNNIMNIILELSIEKNNSRMLVELINRKKIMICNYNKNYMILRAKNYIDNINSIYIKLLYRINKKINFESYNIISFIF